MDYRQFIATLALVLCFHTISDVYCKYSPVVATHTGKVKGVQLTYEYKTVHGFFGIPFAKPPVGKLRFKAPEPIDTWKDTLYAAQKSAPCMQPSYQLEMGDLLKSKKNYSEDCLYLNVWTPISDDNPRKSKAVIVLIYGGGFHTGSTDYLLYDGLVLSALGDVVVVTMNYRVGLLGFLNAGIPEVPGNLGLLDQNLAMNWVADNIPAFGGDASRITLMGLSAGSMSVSAHLLSPMSKGLFARGIMSGGSLYTPAFVENAERSIVRGDEVAKIVGCSKEGVDLASQPSRVVECLRTKDAAELVVAQLEVQKNLISSFLPTYGNPFLPERPTKSGSTGRLHDGSLLIGTSLDEGSLFIRTKLTPDFTDPPEINDPAEAVLYAFGTLSQYEASVPDDEMQLYFDESKKLTKNEVVQKVVDILGDNMFVCPSVRFAEDYASAKNPVYYYRFAQKSSTGLIPDWWGVTHASDFMYAVGIPLILADKFPEEDQQLSRDVIHAFSTFASTGKPPVFRDTDWPVFDKHQQKYLEISAKNVRVGERPRKEFCDYWRTFYL